MTAWQTAHGFFGKYRLLRATSFAAIPATESLLSSCLDSCFLEECFQTLQQKIHKYIVFLKEVVNVFIKPSGKHK